MLPSDMAHNGKNEHKRNRGKTPLVIHSRRNPSRCLLFPNDSSHRAPTKRRRNVVLGRSPNEPGAQCKFPRKAPRSAENTSPTAHFLIANARLKLNLTHIRISHLRISNRERIAFLDRYSSDRPTQAPAHHSSLITPRPCGLCCQFLATRLHHFSFHGIIGFLCSQ
jgi:hypothetical protein